MVATLGGIGFVYGTIQNGVVDRSTCAVTMEFDYSGQVQAMSGTAWGYDIKKLQAVGPTITYAYGPMDLLRVRST